MHELELDTETMRQMGYAVVDRLVEWHTDAREAPVWTGATRTELAALLPSAPPADLRTGDDVAAFNRQLDLLLRDVIPRGARVDHPRFFAFVPGAATWPAVLGDFLAAGCNIFQGTWLASAGVSQLELIVLDWFRQWVGLPDTAGGLLVSGGSNANLSALACARQVRIGSHSPDARIYLSATAHSSLSRAARVLGFADEQLRTIAVDAQDRMAVASLAAAIAEDEAAGRIPLFVVANGGTTSTGVVDPLPAIAALCRAHDVWLHVDAAYGGFTVLTDRGRSLLDGIAAADSVTLDPHKWLFQPFEAGCLLLRDASLLRTAFHVTADYLRDTALDDAPDAPVNFAERGIQLTRSARALKIWISINHFGVDAFRAAIDRTMDLALHAAQLVEATESLELLTPANLGIVCFRRRVPAGCAVGSEEYNTRLVAELAASGVGMISSTRVRGEYALWLCVINYRTTADDVERVIAWLAGHQPTTEG